MTPDDLIALARSERVKPVTVRGVELHVRVFTLDERISIGTRARAGEPLPPVEYLVLGVCNADGSPFFTLEKAQEFAAADGAFAEAVINEVLEHAGLTEAAQERAAKN